MAFKLHQVTPRKEPVLNPAVQLATHLRAECSYKKYILFQYDQYYPSGGTGDIRASADDVEALKAYAKDHYHDYNHIIDRDTWQTVWDSD